MTIDWRDKTAAEILKDLQELLDAIPNDGARTARECQVLPMRIQLPRRGRPPFASVDVLRAVRPT